MAIWYVNYIILQTLSPHITSYTRATEISAFADNCVPEIVCECGDTRHHLSTLIVRSKINNGTTAHTTYARYTYCIYPDGLARVLMGVEQCVLHGGAVKHPLGPSSCRVDILPGAVYIYVYDRRAKHILMERAPGARAGYYIV